MTSSQGKNTSALVPSLESPLIAVRSKNLYESLQEVPDFRRGQGQRHPLSLVLLLLIMATMSGHVGIRATGDFIQKHKKELIAVLGITKQRLPNFATVGRILQHIKYTDFEKVFLTWGRATIPAAMGDWIALDGKAIGGTVTNPHSSSQKYTNLVSAFHATHKQVIGMASVPEDKVSEIGTVRQLIQDLGLTGITFTLDALHCQKETTKVITETGNNYVIGVKGNQKGLFNRVKKTAQPDTSSINTEQKKKIVEDKKLE